MDAYRLTDWRRGRGIGACFAKAVIWATAFRQGHSWTLYLMPAAGVLIVWMYCRCHEENNRGTNAVLEAVSANQEVSLATGPLIFLSTVLTHFVGGSSGREGAALQLGGSLGSLSGKLLKLGKRDRKVAVMCGMSAVFGALFGTPVAAAMFAVEVASVGEIYYAGLLPSVFSAFLGANISHALGVPAEAFAILNLPKFTPLTAAYTVFLGLLCALVSIGFCMFLHSAGKLYRKYIPNPYYRILAASALFILLTFLLGTREYHGGSMQLIEHAMEGHARYEDFSAESPVYGSGFGGRLSGRRDCAYALCGINFWMYRRSDHGDFPVFFSGMRDGGTICRGDELPDQYDVYSPGTVWRGGNALLCHCDCGNFCAFGVLRAVQQPEICLLEDGT